MTLGCQDLSRHLRILMSSSSFSNIFPRITRWLTIWVKLFYTSAIVSPFCILNISYSWIKACFLALFTSFVPSWVTSRVSHISFADSHWDTLKNSSVLNADVTMFYAIWWNPRREGAYPWWRQSPNNDLNTHTSEDYKEQSTKYGSWASFGLFICNFHRVGLNSIIRSWRHKNGLIRSPLG